MAKESKNLSINTTKLSRMETGLVKASYGSGREDPKLKNLPDTCACDSVEQFPNPPNKRENYPTLMEGGD